MILSVDAVKDNLTHPSPDGPKPVPGVVTICNFWRSSAVNSEEVKPAGVFTQT
jgi:hypothetical protein